MSTIVIQGRPLGPQHEPWIIAEMSANHNGTLQRAMQIIEAAAKSGATAIKLQTYTPQSMTLPLDKQGFVIDQPSSLWYGRSLFDLYNEAQTPWHWHKILFEHCKKNGLIGFSSPFDPQAVEFLESLDVPCYKIASLELTDYKLLESVAKTCKPIFVSTGGARLQEIEEAIDFLKRCGSGPIIILKCTTAYPAPFEDANLKTLPHLSDYFGLAVGLSDHTPGIAAPLTAIALGACVIEKHFTLSRADGGVDSAFSLEPDELSLLCKEAKNSFYSLGQVYYGPTRSEKASLALKRSLYVTHEVKQGEAINDENTRAIRPAQGLSPKYLELLKGYHFNQQVQAGTPISWDMVSTDSEPITKLKKSEPVVLAIVQARMGSTRLYGKVLLPLAGQTILEHVICRLKLSQKVDEIVIATTLLSEDDCLEPIALKHGISCFRGSSSDVLSRFITVAEAFQADVIVRITADCPLIDPLLLDQMLESYQQNFSHYDYLSNTFERTYPRGLDIEVFSIHALRDMHQQAHSDIDKEHVTRIVHQMPQRYMRKSFEQAVDLSFHRWTVDTSLDYLYLEQIVSSLAGSNLEVNTEQILKWINNHPQWAYINTMIAQKKN